MQWANLNDSALRVVDKLMEEPSKYSVIIEKYESGATIIDAGIKAPGGFLAGKLVTEICLAGRGRVEIHATPYGDMVLPSIFVQTNQPMLAILASQFGGWHIKDDDFSALASGPARVLAIKPKSLFEKIKYREESKIAVIVLETESKPPAKVIHHIAEKCRVRPENLYLLVFSTASQTGVTQISGRAAETAFYKFLRLGLDPFSVESARGSAPIAPNGPSADVAMKKANYAIIYGGTADFNVRYEDDLKLEALVNMVPSSSSKAAKENKPSLDSFRMSEYDFSKVDPDFFAPCVVTVTNARTGKRFRAGKLDFEALKSSLGIS